MDAGSVALVRGPEGTYRIDAEGRKIAPPDRCPPAKKLFIGIPAYTGFVDIETMHSVTQGVNMLLAAGGEATWTILEGCCYLCHARNQVVEEFLSTDATDLLFVDSDIGFGLEELARIVAATRPVVGGIYRKKCDRMDFNLRVKAGVHSTEPDGLLEVGAVATGFLRINRSVFDALAPTTPRYGIGKDGPRQWRRWFRTLYDPAEDGGQDLEFWGEDFQFSRDLAAAGIKTYCIPGLTLRHVGKKVYEGNWAEWMFSNGAASRKAAEPEPPAA